MFGHSTTLTMTVKRKRWKFPTDRFVSYDDHDEVWARPLGFGKEVEVTETITVPNAVVTSMKPGQITFRAMPIEQPR